MRAAYEVAVVVEGHESTRQTYDRHTRVRSASSRDESVGVCVCVGSWFGGGRARTKSPGHNTELT
mgnify:CR=1 FL=1